MNILLILLPVNWPVNYWSTICQLVVARLLLTCTACGWSKLRSPLLANFSRESKPSLWHDFIWFLWWKTGENWPKNNEKPSTSLPAIELCLALDPTSPANHLASDWGDPDTGSGVYHRIDLIRKALNWSLNPGCAIIVDLVFSCLLLPSNLGSAKPQNYVSKAWIFAASSFCGGPLESSHVQGLCEGSVNTCKNKA